MFPAWQIGRFVRYIPAWVGNSPVFIALLDSLPVHPRVGGEQSSPATCACPVIGTSPRGWGTAQRFLSPARCSRYIPAWVGNSSGKYQAHRKSSVHPRVGGEQFMQAGVDEGKTGTSPRGWGTGLLETDRMAIGRYIPAWVGNRPESQPNPKYPTVHPRVGGEQTGCKQLKKL